MRHITDWAITNKMMINLLKTVELVFRRPNFNHDILPPPLAGIERMDSAKLLGVLFSSNLKFTDHVSSIVSICNQRLYLLSQLRRQGLGASSRDAVFTAIIVNRIMYALPVFNGYLSEKDKSQIMSIFVKARRWQLLLFPRILKALSLLPSIVFFNNHSPAITVYTTFTLPKLKIQMQWSFANEDTILFSPQ
jgi:hypothetical protein